MPMRPVLLTLLSSLVLLAAPAAAGAAALPARASLADCRTSPDQAARYVVFQGDMRRLRPGDRMEVRFDLLIKLPERGTWEKVESEGLGVWNRADGGVGRYRYTKRVENLRAPASYRALVSFRWIDPAFGAIRRQTTRRTPVCRQPDAQADLEVLGVTIGDRPSADRWTYLVDVANRGGVAAVESDLRLIVDGQAEVAQKFAPLAAGEVRRVAVAGRPCPSGRSHAVEIDSSGRVPEAVEGNNVVTLPCPP